LQRTILEFGEPVESTVAMDMQFGLG